MAANVIRTSTDTLSKVDAAQVRDLREAFQLLDRDGDGIVGRDDVTVTLNDLGMTYRRCYVNISSPLATDILSKKGQDASQHTISAFFPPGKPQNVTLAQFLTQLSALLGNMSRPDELASAFAAFDDDDNGQIAVADLRDTLRHTAPEHGSGRPLSNAEIDRVLNGFTGRKTVGKKLGKEEVFRYQEFLAAVSGTGGKGGEQQAQQG